eukprot:CAMPEP_0172445126 /NCGR_PEP_ID=MMETSP1065-20121228/5064_1 /TAXON_ID=265537 /ORGANISM="Amphiprora paludosa, Strain CCMP125" /LENGTH=828 /DNA_ID=CAMNT_0013195921 /DNA_START=192 /DNA_END=2675 /DNA_ORIENTATION=-
MRRIGSQRPMVCHTESKERAPMRFTDKRSRQRWSGLMILLVAFASTWSAAAFTPKSNHNSRKHEARSRKKTDPLFVSTSIRAPNQRRSVVDDTDPDVRDNRKGRPRRKYKRKRSIPESERQAYDIKKQWKADYERIVKSSVVEGEECPNFWTFESLFPEPVLDEASVKRDLYDPRERDAKTALNRQKQNGPAQVSTSEAVADPAMEMLQGNSGQIKPAFVDTSTKTPRERRGNPPDPQNPAKTDAAKQLMQQTQQLDNTTDALATIFAAAEAAVAAPRAAGAKIDRALTRKVEDSMYGYRRTSDGSFQYDTSLMGDGAVKFRDGVRLGKPLRINADRLTYLAKKELQHGRVEEAQELYEQAIRIDPHDGRAYLGLSRCAERRRDFTLARECLKVGITHSATPEKDSVLADRGANPFLLQALGVLEEKMGHLSEAEALYISAAKSRPWHAAAWVALAQLRTRKLGQSADAGRVLFQAAERELRKAGQKPSSHVYTAWAALENKKAHDVRRARELFQAALKVDKKCSAAFLQLGVMEADNENWDEAQSCFDSVLKFDQRNSRVLQAYALMETKRPDGDSRKAIGLFERALKANSRDAGVLQAYALYVAKLGDVDAARDLFKRATEVNKRHSPVWQAWGVLEMREENPEVARSIFQQGIWACAQLAGGQSGGYSCARLWQAWGLLESEQGDHSAARRCFSRALDADSRNVATVTAWSIMEEALGNIADARAILERALKQFAPGSEAKQALWMTYEKMEQRLGNTKEAQRIYQRSMRETLEKAEVRGSADTSRPNIVEKAPVADELTLSEAEVEVVRWDGGSSSLGGGGEVW